MAHLFSLFEPMYIGYVLQKVTINLPTSKSYIVSVRLDIVVCKSDVHSVHKCTLARIPQILVL